MAQDKVVLYQQLNGIMAIIVPCWEQQGAEEAEGDFLSRLAAQSIQADRPERLEGQSEEDYNAAISAADARPWKEILRAEIESTYSSRTYRNAWKFDEQTEEHGYDLNKARAIQIELIRQKRDSNLKIQDIDTLKGIENQLIKQIQRDIPQIAIPLLAAASTIEEIEAVWPIELNL